MERLASIWERARVDLVLPIEHADPGSFLWDHVVRVARSAESIARLPQVIEQNPDVAAIVAAALYHESGWMIRAKEGTISPADVFSRSIPESHREQSARYLEKCLENVLPSGSLEKASQAVRTLNDRDVSEIEGLVIAEAENLDEFGVPSLWIAIRQGKGVKAILETWHRRKEYRFWTARLNDSFRFAAVREIAQERLNKLERVMQELEEQQEALDVRAMIESTTAPPTPSSPLERV